MTKSNQSRHQLAEHFFRHSYGKTVAVLVRYFGLQEVETAEDIVHDTLVEAMEKWSIQDLPDNPDGWIMDVAKKKTINLLKRKQLFQSRITPQVANLHTVSDAEVTDSTLRMIFACCHPLLPPASQIALALKTLCGLSIPETASALLTSEENVNKRLYRAKKMFRTGQIPFAIPENHEYTQRLDGVCKTLYLLFNEGYLPLHQDKTLRTDLCYEAVRLARQMEVHDRNSGKVNGLLALMFFSLARFESRIDNRDSLVYLPDQDRTLWDSRLISQGMHYLTRSVRTVEFSVYQLQAGIAAEHCLAPDFASTNWQSIYDQYTLLEELDSSILVRMNRLIAYYYLGHQSEALKRLVSLESDESFKVSASFYLTIGTLSGFSGQATQAKVYLQKAISLTRSEKEKALIQRRLDSI